MKAYIIYIIIGLFFLSLIRTTMTRSPLQQKLQERNDRIEQLFQELE